MDEIPKDWPLDKLGYERLLRAMEYLGQTAEAGNESHDGAFWILYALAVLVRVWNR